MQNERAMSLISSTFQSGSFCCAIGCYGSHQTSYWSWQPANEPHMSTSLSGIIVVFNIDISCTNYSLLIME